MYDGGYFSRALLQARNNRQVEGAFRLKRNANTQVCGFVTAGSRDEVVTMEPAGKAPLRLRLVWHAVHGTPYVLGTTLLDAKLHPVADLADI